MTQIIRTMVVDDSAFVRKVVREMLTRSPYIEVVGAARDGEEALAMVESLRPDVVTCDLIMPRLDGVGFVRKQMALRPIPILLLTSSPQDGEQALEALQAGAVDLVQKPTALATQELLGIRDELVEKVKAAARAPVSNLINGAVHQPLAAVTTNKTLKVDVVVIGISTGGPQALRHMIPEFPANLPVPVAMVLHMPVGYTALFAEKLNEISALEVREAKDGDVLRPGLALLAPAGRHLQFRRTAQGAVVAHLTMQPLEKNHRPSVDVLFQSASEIFGSRVLGVVMTGMGDDGREGAAWIKAQGGTILTEDEKSCIIYGMPRTVVESGLSDGTATLDRMARTIIENI
jgi:two-component system, chemotaxis family, protein-glutamate methylesterase/glutaminase